MAQPAFDVGQDEIQRIAYEIWESEGRPAGRDADHYYRAERLLAERQNGPVAVKPAAARARSTKAAAPKSSNGTTRETTSTRTRKAAK